MNRKSITGFAGWLIAFLGFPPGGLLAYTLIGHLDNPLEGIIGGAAAGLIIGAVGWLALRRWLPVDARWIIATTVGLAAGVSLTTFLFGTDTTIEAVLLRAPLTGLLMGVAQWVILRQALRQASLWIIATTLIYPLAWWITAQVITTNVNEGFVVFGASGALVYQALTGLVLGWLARFSTSMGNRKPTPAAT